MAGWRTAELEEAVGIGKDSPGGLEMVGRAFVGQWQHTQRPWGQAEAGAGTNSSDLTRKSGFSADLSKNKWTNASEGSRCTKSFFFFFFLIPIKGKALHYYTNEAKAK